VKAFNSTFASRLANLGPLDVFIAGDDADAKKKIAGPCLDADLTTHRRGQLQARRCSRGAPAAPHASPRPDPGQLVHRPHRRAMRVRQGRPRVGRS
jgi:hypothetical protein